MKTEYIRARVEPHLKAEVHHVFDELGLTPSQAINIFYKMVVREHGLPFDMHIPNAETEKAIKEARQRKGVKSFKNMEDLFKDLGL